MTEITAFEPRIVAFLCNWCTYTGADLAGTSRLQYPPNVRIIRTMCSSAVDPVYVLKPLLEGADGVLIGGMGFDDERVWLRWISASEGQKFASTVTDMVTAMKELGPNPARENWAA